MNETQSLASGQPGWQMQSTQSMQPMQSMQGIAPIAPMISMGQMTASDEMPQRDQRQMGQFEAPLQAQPQAPATADSGIIRLEVGATLSEAAIFNGVIYLAGQVADDVTQNIEGQTRAVLAHVDRLLGLAGSDPTRILMCQVYLADIKDFEGMNRVWNEWVATGNAPPRATVQAKLARPEWLVEIVVTAAAGTGSAAAFNAVTADDIPV